MHISVALLLVLSFMTLEVGQRSAFGAAESDKGLILQVSGIRSRLVPYEPLIVDVVLRNESTVPISIPPDIARHLTIETRLPAEHQWTRHTKWWKPQVLPPPRAPERLEGGGERLASIAIHTFDWRIQPVFARGSEYEVRVEFRNSGPDLLVVSQPRRFSILDLPSSEEAPLKALMELAGRSHWSRHIFNLLPDMSSSEEGRKARLPDMEKIISKYPDSVYAIYLRRSYIACAYLPVRWPDTKDPNAGTVEKYRSYLKEHAPWALKGLPESKGSDAASKEAGMSAAKLSGSTSKPSG